VKSTNNPHVCLCSRRADGFAVGKPGNLLWYCDECGPAIAKMVLKMTDKAFDAYEQRAVTAASEAGGEYLDGAGKGDAFDRVTPEEWSEMTVRIIRTFADTIRREVESGVAPF
jgi:hypothetical protein